MHIVTEAYLREVIRQTLLEDGGGGDGGGGDGGGGDGGGGDGGGYGGYGGYGMGGGGGGMGGMGNMWSGSVMTVLFGPFLDVLKTGAGALENIASKGQQVAEVILQGIPTLIIPGLAAKYNEIKQAEARRAKEIQGKYAEVLKRNSDAFVTDGHGGPSDAMGFAFMLAPAHFINTMLFSRVTPAIAKGAVSATLELLDVASGRSKIVGAATNAIRQYAETGEAGGSSEKRWKMLNKILAGTVGGSAAALGFKSKKKGRIAKPPSPEALMKKLLGMDKVQSELAKSKTLQGMKQDTEAMISSTLEQLVQTAEQTQNIKDFDDLNSLTKSKLKIDELASLPPEEQSKIKQIAVAQAKKGGLNVIVTQMKREIKWLKKQGIDADHPYILAYERAIEKIKN